MVSNEEKHYLSGKRLIISGGGIGGLTFCIAFQHFLNETTEKIDPLPEIILYERDKSFDDNGRQGYSLSLRSDPYSGGMQVLDKLGILNQIIDLSNPDTYFSIFNNDFSPIIEISSPSVEGLPRSSLRISRVKLREILLKNIQSTIEIRWNCSITSVKQVENEKILVYLSDGSEQQADFLIAADGSNSQIRQILRLEHQLQFAGAVSIIGETDHLDKFPSPLDKTHGGAIGNDGHFVFIAPSQPTTALWSLSYLSSTPRQTIRPGTINSEQSQQILDEVKLRTKLFGQPIPTLLERTLPNTLTILNAKDLTPFRNHGSVIFIGDAQHAMSPFAGNGANMAIIDAYQLAQQLIYSKDLNKAIHSYDDLTIPRSTKAINISRRTIQMAHSQGISRFIYVILLKLISWALTFYYGNNQQTN